MRTKVKIVITILVAAFALAQFIRPSRINPPVNEPDTLRASSNLAPEVDAVLVRSCNDCHSNETRYPWYSNITPANWFLDSHIRDGRAELNFSEWNTYTARRKARKLDEICEQVETGAMPLPSYLWVQRKAALSPDEVRLLCDWAMSEKARVAPE